MVKVYTMHLAVCLLVMVFIIPALVQGTTECYQCVYMDGYDIDKLGSPLGLKSEKACKKGNKLGDFAIKCNGYDSWTRSAHNTSGLQEAEDTSYVCAKLTTKGKVSGQKTEVVYRICMPDYEHGDWTNTCTDTSLEKIVSGESSEFYGVDVESIKRFLKPYDVSSDTEVNMCACTGEKCNSAATTGGIISFAVVLAFATKLF